MLSALMYHKLTTYTTSIARLDSAKELRDSEKSAQCLVIKLSGRN